VSVFKASLPRPTCGDIIPVWHDVRNAIRKCRSALFCERLAWVELFVLRATQN